MWGGMRFQIFGPQAENARFPNWVCVLTTTAVLVVEERSCRRPCTENHLITKNTQRLHRDLVLTWPRYYL